MATLVKNQKQMPKNFDFAEAEPRLYKWWEENGWFRPEVAGADAEPYVISMPPPNITGALHMGHAIFTALEDLMIRYARMQGRAALWVPGTDHAGIATQLQIEKMLQDEGTSREEVGREVFLARTWAWKQRYGGEITQQLRRLGASCDWTRERFTLDDGLSRAVRDVFITLWDQGLIYRGPRLVNWSPGLQTAVSDLEVEREEENGKLYFFNYPLEGGEFLPVATTRPETILGDTAVCVHPDDPRYQKFIGKKAYVPILNREIAVIADEYVDPEFGTGALKITPAHDFNDYAIGQKHNLRMINVMTRKATINENGGPYEGLDRFEARKKLWADMEAAGLTLRVEDRVMVVPRSQRGGEVIEPLISTQWFLKIQPLAEKALNAVRNDDIEIVPERFKKIYYHWMENIEDWCISRQLWWGHRIPAWINVSGEVYVGKEPPKGDGWTAEEDVLDTWFSSGLWPFSTLGWPENTPDLQRYYPTHMMETGYDILFFWVARMIMMGLWFTDKPPFKTVYLHGIVRDAQGRKMSKTLGNTVDPVELIEKYGADPLRFTLLTSGTPGNDLNLDTNRVESEWKFINKLWQITNFITSNLDAEIGSEVLTSTTLDLPSRWLLSRLNRLIASVQKLFDIYQYGEAGRQIRSFLWDEFADWYIEISKHALYGGDETAKQNTRRVLVHTLDTCLRLLHPFMPFVTEEIWSFLPGHDKPLIISQWPETNTALIDDQAEAQMDTLMDMVRGIRNVRAEYDVDAGRRISVVVAPGSHAENIQSHDYLFARLCNVSDLQLLNGAVPDDAASVVVSDVTIYLPLKGLIDYAAEIERLSKEQGKLQDQIAKSEATLSNEGFVSHARPDVVQRERDKLTELQASAQQIDLRLQELRSKI
jgi:valyl-tRNA synthetase